MRAVPVALAIAVLTGCTPKPAPELSWDFNAHPTSGEVRVLPVVPVYEAPTARYDSYVTDAVPDWRRVLRQERAAEVASVPREVRLALPGAINAELEGSWDGRFRCGRFPVGARDRLAGAIRSGRGVEPVLSDIGKHGQGDAVLVTWVDDLRSEPLTTLGFPGDLIDTPAGPVVVDLVQEQHTVTAHVGVALVDGDGAIVMRMSRSVESVVSLRVDADDAARKMAQVIAHDIALVWPHQAQLGYPTWPTSGDGLAQR